MNVVLIMAGGIGSRFGAVIPKQYTMISGRPVIDYVIDAVQESRATDKVVVVMDKQWLDYSEKLKKSNFDYADNGSTRHESMYNGLKFIKENYACDKVVIVDAVAPFLYAGLIDDYFRKLDEYDAVITAQKISGGLTDINNQRLDRERYMITQSPEGFRFELLWNNYDIKFPYQETAGMLPEEASRYYYYGFKNNLKLTYDFESEYAAVVLQSLGKLNSKKNVAFFDKGILLTEGIKSYLLRNEREKTLQWIDFVYDAMPKIIAKWELTSFLPNQLSRFGLVVQAESQKYRGGVIVKFIPDFVGRYERELEAFQILSQSYMCRLLEADEAYHVMLLQKIAPARYACFEENIKLTDFFRHVIEDAVEYNDSMHLKYIPDYFEELKSKLENLSAVPYCRNEIGRELTYAIELYGKEFANAPKYILHGDLHEWNILDDGNRYWGIDPNGLLGPIELECVRFIRNDVRNHPAFGFEERFKTLIHNFARLVDSEKLVKIFIVDMAFCTYNSAFKNEKPDETRVNLKLIDIARKQLQTYGNPV